MAVLCNWWSILLQFSIQIRCKSSDNSITTNILPICQTHCTHPIQRLQWFVKIAAFKAPLLKIQQHSTPWSSSNVQSSFCIGFSCNKDSWWSSKFTNTDVFTLTSKLNYRQMKHFFYVFFFSREIERHQKLLIIIVCTLFHNRQGSKREGLHTFSLWGREGRKEGKQTR